MKYFYVEYLSDHVWRDNQCLKAKSEKQIIDQVKYELELLRDYHLDKKLFKKIYKRFNMLNIYQDDNKPNTIIVDTQYYDSKPIGKVIEMQGTLKENDDSDSVITAYLYKVAKKDVQDNFTEIEKGF